MGCSGSYSTGVGDGGTVLRKFACDFVYSWIRQSSAERRDRDLGIAFVNDFSGYLQWAMPTWVGALHSYDEYGTT